MNDRDASTRLRLRMSIMVIYLRGDDCYQASDHVVWSKMVSEYEFADTENACFVLHTKSGKAER